MNSDYFGDRYWIKEGNHEELQSPAMYRSEDSPFTLLKETSEGTVSILLGAAGMGKSFELEKEYQRLKSEDSIKCVKILLGSEGYHSFKDKLEGSVLQPLKDKEKVHLFLDALDETGDRFEDMESLIASNFGQIPEQLTIYLTCRGTFWPKSLENALRKAAKKRFQKLTLHPLNEDESHHSAHQFGISWEKALTFSEEIEARKLRSLTSNPLTFIMLLKEYKESGKFPEGQIVLLKQGLLRLSEESNEKRVEKCKVGSLTPKERLRFAGRIAILTLFSEKSNIHTGNTSQASQESTITLSELQERKIIENLGGKEIEINLRNLKEVCATALFTPVKEHTFRWAHKEFETHAACQYIQQNGLSADEILQLVSSSELSGQPIFHRYHSLCSSIAFYSKEFSFKLYETQPELLLYGHSDLNENTELRKGLLRYRLKEVEAVDVPQSTEQRSVQRYQQNRLKEVETGNLSQSAEQWSAQRYHQLKHPEIVEQLKNLFHSENQKLLEELVTIVTTLDLRDLENDIAKLVLQQRLDIYWLHQTSQWIVENEKSVHKKKILDLMMDLTICDSINGSIRRKMALLLLQSGNMTQKAKFGELFPETGNPKSDDESFLQHIALRVRLDCRQITKIEFFNHLKLSTRWDVDKKWLKRLICDGSVSLCIAILRWCLRLIEKQKMDRSFCRLKHEYWILTVLERAWEFLEDERLRILFVRVFIAMNSFLNRLKEYNKCGSHGSQEKNLITLLQENETKRRSFFLTLFNIEDSLQRRSQSIFEMRITDFHFFYLEEDFLWYAKQAIQTEDSTIKVCCGKMMSDYRFHKQQRHYYKHQDLLSLYTGDYHFSKAYQLSYHEHPVDYLSNFLNSLSSASLLEEKSYWAGKIQNVYFSLDPLKVGKNRKYLEQILEGCRQSPRLEALLADELDLKQSDPVEALLQRWKQEKSKSDKMEKHWERMKEFSQSDSIDEFLEAFRFINKIVTNKKNLTIDEEILFESVLANSKNHLPDLAIYQDYIPFLYEVNFRFLIFKSDSLSHNELWGVQSDKKLKEARWEFLPHQKKTRWEFLNHLFQYQPDQETEDKYNRLICGLAKELYFDDFCWIFSMEQIVSYDQSSWDAIDQLYLDKDKEKIEDYWKANKEIVYELAKKGRIYLVDQLFYDEITKSLIQLSDIVHLIDLIKKEKPVVQRNLADFIFEWSTRTWHNLNDFNHEMLIRKIWEGCQCSSILHQKFSNTFPLNVPDPYQHYLDKKKFREESEERIIQDSKNKMMLESNNQILLFQQGTTETWIQLNALFYNKLLINYRFIFLGEIPHWDEEKFFSKTVSENKKHPHLRNWNSFNNEQHSQIITMAETYLQNYQQGSYQYQSDDSSLLRYSCYKKEELKKVQEPYIAGYDAIMLLFLYGKDRLSTLIPVILEKWFDCLLEISRYRMRFFHQNRKPLGKEEPQDTFQNCNHLLLVQAIRKIDTQKFDECLLDRYSLLYWEEWLWDASLSESCWQYLKSNSLSPSVFEAIFSLLFEKEESEAIQFGKNFLRDYDSECNNLEHELLSTEKLIPLKVTIHHVGFSFSQKTSEHYNPNLLQTEKWIIIAEFVLEKNLLELYEHIWPVVIQYPSIGIKLFQNRISNELPVTERDRLYCWIVSKALIHDNNDKNKEYWVRRKEEQLNAIIEDEDSLTALKILKRISKEYAKEENWDDKVKTVRDRYLKEKPTPHKPKGVLDIVKNRQLSIRAEEEFFPNNDLLNKKINDALRSAEDDLKRGNPPRSLHGSVLSFEALVKSKFPSDNFFYQFQTLGYKGRKEKAGKTGIREAFSEQSDLPAFFVEFIFLMNSLRNCIPGAAHESCALIEIPFSKHEAILFLELTRAIVRAEAIISGTAKKTEEDLKTKAELNSKISKKQNSIEEILSLCSEWEKKYETQKRKKLIKKEKRIYSTFRQIYDDLKNEILKIVSWFEAGSKPAISETQLNELIQANELIDSLIKTIERIHRS